MTEYAFWRSQFGKITLLTIILIAGVLSDWALKLLARSLLTIHDPVAVWPGLNLTSGFNRGIAFGFFPVESLAGLYTIITIQLLILCGVLFMFFRSTDFVMQLSLASIVTGAFANLFDRMLLGGVTDFLDFYIAEWYWPAFNLADILICVGIGGLLAADLLTLRKTKLSDFGKP